MLMGRWRRGMCTALRPGCDLLGLSGWLGGKRQPVLGAERAVLCCVCECVCWPHQLSQSLMPASDADASAGRSSCWRCWEERFTVQHDKDKLRSDACSPGWCTLVALGLTGVLRPRRTSGNDSRDELVASLQSTHFAALSEIEKAAACRMLCCGTRSRQRRSAGGKREGEKGSTSE